ncbi:50S ribosomal protein L17 [Candidatus Omnitrophota bacterium]
MRHRKKRGQLGKQPSHRAALLMNMVINLFRFQKIHTTRRRAKEARKLAEKLITMGKDADLFARRKAYAALRNRKIVVKLFDEIAPLFKQRAGGYTRIIPLGFRKGDNASMVILELTEKKEVKKTVKKKKDEDPDKASQRPEPKKKKEGAPEKERPKEEKIKPAGRDKPTPREEKAEQKAKSEDKKIADKKGFLKNLRGYFRRKTNM